MPYLIRDDNGNPIGVLAHKPLKGDVEYVSKDHPDIAKYKKWKVERKKPDPIDKKIQKEQERLIRKMAIDNLKDKGEIPADYENKVSS